MPLNNPGRWWMLPQKLKDLNQWVLRDENKMPINPITKKPAKADDPTTWSNFDSVKNSDKIGCELVGLIGIDFDHIYAYNTPFSLWAQDWVKKFATITYVEYSPSGTGCHVIGSGTFVLGDTDRKEIFDQESPKVKKGKTFVYDVNALIVTPRNINGKITDGRYFTMTGNYFPDTKMSIEDITDQSKQFYTELIAKFGDVKTITKVPIKTQPTGDDIEIMELLEIYDYQKRFERFKKGDIAGYPSNSEADFACACMIAFYTRDASQIERIMRNIMLAREKWDKHKTYLARTINNALSTITEHYTPPDEIRAFIQSIPK
jgi:primase-polymerase (primpol)-like protein